MSKDEYVLEFWKNHNVVPSDIEPDDFKEIADALEGKAPPELIDLLRQAG